MCETMSFPSRLAPPSCLEPLLIGRRAAPVVVRWPGADQLHGGALTGAARLQTELLGTEAVGSVEVAGIESGGLVERPVLARPGVFGLPEGVPRGQVFHPFGRLARKRVVLHAQVAVEHMVQVPPVAPLEQLAQTVLSGLELERSTLLANLVEVGNQVPVQQVAGRFHGRGPDG